MLDDSEASAEVGAGPGACHVPAPRSQSGLKPVLIILHQPHSNPGHVGQWLVKHGHALDVRRPRFGCTLPETLEHHAGAVIFGGPMSANDPDEFIGRETEWIGLTLREKKPFLGICLGAQMLARHLGARAYEHREKRVEIGYFDIKSTENAGRFGGVPGRVYQWHREGFDLAQGSVALAVADGHFENQAFACGSAVGLQFHPEITYAMVNRWTGVSSHRLTEPRAQTRGSQMADHIAHGPGVRRWLDSFMPRWLAADQLA